MLVLFVFAWVGIFGGLGALLSRSRGGSSVAGLAWGVVLGPFGWAAIWLTTRAGGREVTAEQWTEEAALDEDWTASLLAEPGGRDA